MPYLPEYETIPLYNLTFHSPTDEQVNCLENNPKIYIRTAPTCFWCSHAIISERIIRAC